MRVSGGGPLSLDVFLCAGVVWVVVIAIAIASASCFAKPAWRRRGPLNALELDRNRSFISTCSVAAERRRHKIEPCPVSYWIGRHCRNPQE
jgi:hypothetical protein